MEPLPVVPIGSMFGLDLAHTNDNKPWIALHCSSNLGVHTYFLDPRAALQLANEMRKMAKDQLSGLAVVENRLLDANGDSVRLDDQRHRANGNDDQHEVGQG